MLRAIDFDHGEPCGDAPEIAAVGEAGIDGCNLVIACEKFCGCRRKEINVGEVDLGVAIVSGGVDEEDAVLSAEKIILLGIAVKQRGRDGRAAQFMKMVAQAINLLGEMVGQVA